MTSEEPGAKLLMATALPSTREGPGVAVSPAPGFQVQMMGD